MSGMVRVDSRQDLRLGVVMHEYPHIPAQRVRASATVLERLGGAVTMRLYPGLGHTVNRDEADAVNRLLAAARG